MDWDDIRVFVAVAEFKSLTKAAQALRVTVGQISRRLSELETRLGATLVSRTTAGISLTKAGEDVLDMALSMQRFADAIEGAARGRDQREEGVVAIAAPDGLAALWLAPRIADFLNANPRIQFSVDCGLWAREPLAAAPDLTITPDISTAQIGDATELLCTLHYLFVAAPKYIETYGAPSSLAAAAGDHRTLKQVAQTFQRNNWGKRAEAVETLSSFSVESNSSALVMNAILTGAGIGTVPSYCFQDYPDLVVVGPLASVSVKLWLVTHDTARHSARVKRVAGWLRTIFDTKTNPWFREEFVPPSQFAAELEATAKRRAPSAAAKAQAAQSRPTTRTSSRRRD
jgi:DNA-binding transcriptional LysR family regulator